MDPLNREDVERLIEQKLTDRDWTVYLVGQRVGLTTLDTNLDGAVNIVNLEPLRREAGDEDVEFNHNEYSARDEEGRWWLIGGPNGPVRHPNDPQ